jgi:DNA-binding LacI/PurR family transcriptional regulator
MYTTMHPNLANRLAAFRETMQRLGPGVDEGLIRNLWQPEPFTAHLGTGLVAATPSPEWRREQVRGLFERPDPATAIFCPSDFVAAEVHALLRELGLAVPERVTLTGFDDTLEARYISPALTTVHVPLAEMGAMAVKRLAEKMREKAGGVVSYSRTVLPGTIIERGSHRAIH